MSDLFNGTSWIPWAVLVTALAGSAHCTGMCGGLVLAVCRKPSDHLRYQLGRGLAYAALGALAGGIGEVFLQRLGPGVSYVTAAFMALGFILMGIQVWRKGTFHVPVPTSWFQKVPAIPSLMGFGSAVLPCGFLHAFVLASSTTGSALSGAAFMSVFWLGTLPAVSFAPAAIRELTNRIPALRGRTSTRVIGVGFLLMGVGTVFAKILGTLGPVASQACH